MPFRISFAPSVFCRVRPASCGLFAVLLASWLPGRSQPARAAPATGHLRASAVVSHGRIGKISSFIPAGHEVYARKKADLNLDGRPDVLLILAPKDERENFEKTGKGVELHHRLLLLLTGLANRQFQARARNSNAVYCYSYDNNFLDCLEELNLKRGQFTMIHSGGYGVRWYRETTFTYQPATATWRLSMDVKSTFDAMNPDDESTEDLLKRYVSLSRFNIYDF